MLLDCNEKSVKLDTSSSSAKMEFTRDDMLICAVNGYAYAIHKKDGTILWEKYIAITAAVISVYVTDNDRVIAAAVGVTHSIDLMTGEIIWSNDMTGFGYLEVSIVTTPSGIVKPLQLLENEADELYLPPCYEMVAQDQQVIIACSKGGAMAIDLNTGNTLWQYNCSGGGYNIPVAIIEPPNQKLGRPTQLAYIGSGRCVYCLNARTGYLVWSVSLSWNLLGSGYMTLASPWSSKLGAETNTAFSQNPTAQTADKGRLHKKNNNKNGGKH
ncbi:hypothetical protein INT48_008094 [Thamnidium elegans]|uniref:Pyrrolo-quinoline quinone repeat domain-containing protein n=1 Tax=Thamnidium elegans TaxID=101142 RepID=A0A8H7SH37_9FUNG|nr:hypothetical protein INT48_008094 [Thamnidium elegans]